MLYIVTFNKYFGQHLYAGSSLNIEEIKNILIEWKVKTELIELNDLINTGINKDDHYWITSHQNKDIKKYLNDVVLSLFINNKDNLITPIELYFAHENKGIQSLLYENGKGINLVNQNYYINSINIGSKSVFKMIDGYGSNGVRLVNNKNDIEKIIKKQNLLDTSISRIIEKTKQKIKKIILRKSNKIPESYQSERVPYVIQDFITGLKFDYKVLIFWNHVYVLERKVRKNDFRASGSGLFNFIEADKDLIIFCKKIRDKIKSPFLSLDIVKCKNNTYYCIEYQGTHFGPYTQINAEFYYEINSLNDVIKEKNINTLEHEYAYSILNHLRDN
ncbi:hypothetical protein [Providencia rettgeri]|uniref:hypothetical protein n=1 Tax=Providencia rettgeri TaxID=587 RepID=UPI0025A7EDAC|nr:hypothetical protein [Providencia rettgeri]ELR5223348.1 hypothetical protein [Providencia rettgeri]MDX7323548.1 hypothetical protein [Providencia rettgeri]